MAPRQGSRSAGRPSPKRSHRGDRPGRSRPLWAFRYRHPEPRQRRCLPASLCGLGVGARFDRNRIDKRLIVRLALARRDSHRLPMRFRDKLRSPHVRNPDLNLPETLGAQPPPMLTHSIPSVRHAEMLDVTTGVLPPTAVTCNAYLPRGSGRSNNVTDGVFCTPTLPPSNDADSEVDTHTKLLPSRTCLRWSRALSLINGNRRVGVACYSAGSGFESLMAH